MRPGNARQRAARNTSIEVQPPPVNSGCLVDKSIPSSLLYVGRGEPALGDSRLTPAQKLEIGGPSHCVNSNLTRDQRGKKTPLPSFSGLHIAPECVWTCFDDV